MSAAAEPMDETRSEGRAALCVALLAFLLLAPGILYGLPSGKAVVGGQRVLAGELPYRDFWTMYAPGQFYLQALLQGVFGRGIVAQALACVAVYAAAAGLVFRVARRVGCTRGLAGGTALVFALMSWDTSPELDSYPPALLLMVVALERVSAYLAGASRRALLVAGLALGCAAWFKHDVAAYAALGSSAGITIAWYACGQRPASWLAPLQALRPLVLGCVVALAPVVLFVAATAPREAWQDLFVFPATTFREVRGERFPPLVPELEPLQSWLAAPGDLAAGRNALMGLRSWLLLRVPELAFLVALVLVWRKRLAPLVLGTALVLLAPMPLFWSAAHVQQNTHLKSLALSVLLLGALAWMHSGGRQRVALGVLAGAYALGLAILPASQAWLMASAWPKSRTLGLPATGPVRVSAREHAFYSAIVGWVRAHTEPGEPLYCGLVRHDAPVIGNQRFHYLAERPPATRWTEMHPGITDSEEIQRATIQALEAGGVRCAVLWEFGRGRRAAGLDSLRARHKDIDPSLGSDLLDRWLAERFAQALAADEYVVLWSRAAGPPP